MIFGVLGALERIQVFYEKKFFLNRKNELVTKVKSSKEAGGPARDTKEVLYFFRIFFYPKKGKNTIIHHRF